MSFDRQPYSDALRATLEQNVFYHSLALEACMGAIYDYLQANGGLSPNEPPRGEWVLAGLVHDADFYGDYKDVHPNKTKEALAAKGLEIPDSVDLIVKAHAPQRTGVNPNSKAQWALYCADTLTGLITACTLVIPSKKLGDVKLSSVLKKFKDKSFAAGTRREEVAKCADAQALNIPLDKFVEVCLDSMKKIAPEIGL
ncbi:MAG: hypothetical protein WC792_04285 [Candidatus Micrarchaeia archaeon]|jgi:predicted hydrolase (HD superfamily)